MNKKEILIKAKNWFREKVAANHQKNTKKLINPNNFNINPFLTVYLAYFLHGEATPETVSEVLLLPRVLGTSITTSFGANIQSFTNEVLSSFGSTTSGIDIEFVDQVDHEKKYCQLKAGPNTINKDDVETIAGHFKDVINLARVNKLRIHHSQMVVGVIYGEVSELSSHYRRITTQYFHPVITGQDFWRRLTGDADFYKDLIHAIGNVATEANYSKEFKSIAKVLAGTDKIKNFI